MAVSRDFEAKPTTRQPAYGLKFPISQGGKPKVSGPAPHPFDRAHGRPDPPWMELPVVRSSFQLAGARVAAIQYLPIDTETRNDNIQTTYEYEYIDYCGDNICNE
jgi:hypothetical protein